MPVSFPSQLSPIMRLLLEADPGTILDVGIGNGIYGRLAAHYFGESSPGFMRIDGVEPWGGYADWRTDGTDGRPFSMNWHAYDNVYQGPWPSFGDGWTGYEADPLERYDVGLMIDVVEHFPESEAPAAVDALLAVCDLVILATPLDPADQHSLPNPWETHRSRWLPREIADRWPALVVESTGESTVACLSRVPGVVSLRRSFQRTV